MPKLINRLIGKGKKKEDSTTLPLPGASRSHGVLATIPLGDTIPTLPVTTSAANVPTEKIGLFELSTNECEKNIDVVAVHGLQGDAYKTWEHDNGSLWLRDFLPADIPHARIMTFGYDSTVAFSKSVARIEDKALELLNHLSAKRSPTAPGSLSRPIIFICHSLGGIVVKKALIIAHERDSNLDFKDILFNTRGIAFLGVPHRGSDIAWWASFAAKLLRNASVGTSTNVALLSDLEKGSATLANISTQFVDRARKMIIYTFYETEKLNKIMVVDKQSALIGPLPNESEFPVNANHRTICKIPSSTSHEYKTVGRWIAILAQRVLADHDLHGKISETQAPSYYQVPNRRVRQFVGREDILQKIDKALSTGPGPRIAVLQGMGGQGKSQIALEYCHRKKDTLYSAIFWIDATTEDSVKGSFQTISEQIKKPTDVLPDIQARVAFVLKIFCSWPAHWLLVLDNYDNPSAFPNIADFIPQSSLGAILVTSRHADSDTLVLDQSNQFIKLYGLEESAAVLLLSQQSQSKDFDAEDAEKIVERLGYHPLAITQAGAYIKRRGLQLSHFMKVYKKQREAILTNTPPLSQYRKKLDSDEKETSLNVFTTWELSFQQLQSQASANNVEAKLLTLFAFFDNKDISEQILAEFGAINEEASESAKLLTWLSGFTNASGQWDTDSFAEVLITLRDLSLLQGFAQEPDGFYHSSLHPLVKDWIRLRTSKSIGQESTYMAACLLRSRLSNSWHSHKQYFELPLFAQQNILLNIVTLEEASEEFFVSQLEILANQGIFNEYLNSQFWFAKYLLSIGSYQLAETISHRVVVQMKKYFGLEHPDTLSCTASLAATYRNQGRWNEAEELEVQVMETDKRVLGPEHPDTLTSTGNLALTYLNQGRWKEAEELVVQVIETRKRVVGPEHPDTLISMSNLALTYLNQGRWNEAEELGVQVMETRKRVVGPEHPDTLMSMGNLALTYQSQGRWKEAKELGVQLMETRKRVLGLGHPDTLTSMGILASTYWNQGRWKEAEELGVQVVEANKRVLGPEHPDTHTSMANLALTYRSQGRWKEAEELGAQVMETRKRVLGLEHPYTLTSMANLELTYCDQGRWKEAEELGVQVMETRKRVLGPEHPDTLISTASLAFTYGSQGRWKEAEELGVKVLEAGKRVLGPEHPDTLSYMANLASTFWIQHQREQAIQLMTQVVQYRQQTIGPGHPMTISSMNELQEWRNQME